MEKLNLLLAIHCHQPVGNFGIIFSKAYEESYLPFIEVLEKHPNVKISLHYSGSLLSWLKLTHPEFIKRIKNLVNAGQVEILAGGYYEPVLSLIPQSDAIGQIAMLRKEIKDLFSWESDGCWLTERVWEPKLPLILNKAGIKWTIVDDSHFKSAGLNPQDLSGYYITEEESMPLAVFPASEKLRYLMPFRLPGEGIDYLKSLHEHNIGCVCFADDGEKFGLWPGTNKWVYEQNWLDNFFRALEENSSWLTVNHFSQYLKEHTATSRIYLNCASYREMMDWSGGYFRNFLLKYEESNWMHKRMLYVSNKLNKLKGNRQISSRLSQAKRHLYMAQSNDAYWHGVFGGLYLNHLRSCVYSNLIEAEKIIDNSSIGHKLEVQDLDFNGQAEVTLSSGQLSCIFAPYRGGALLELDYKPSSVNLINTLMRRKEGYHQKLKQKLQSIVSQEPNQPHSIHHLENIKQDGLENFLFYDLFPRYCCLDHFLSKQVTPEQFLHSEYVELGDFIQGEYNIELMKKSNAPRKNKTGFKLTRSGKVENSPVKLIKEISLVNNKLILGYTIKNESGVYLASLFAVEFNLSVYDHQLSQGLADIKTNSVKVSDLWNGISLEFNTDAPASVWHFPVQTVSESETGIEKIYQELCLVFNWPLEIAPHAGWSQRLELIVK
ncbi:MAG: alpha-amylase/4-alpha-glucanotransferase domain-containing protein [Candidatus Omnitrophota bacterium]